MQLVLHSAFQSAFESVLFAMLGAAAGVIAARAAAEYSRILHDGGGVDAATLQDSLRLALRFPLDAAAPRSLLAPVGLAAAGFMALHGLHGLSTYTALAVMAGIIVLLLALIDARTGFLPDALTLPLLWLGLAAAWGGHGVPLGDAVAGAMLGYAFLWLIMQIIQWLRGVQALGRGDLKFLAALGAWVGWQALPTVLLLACIAGALCAMWCQKTLRPSGSSPFGPFLAAGGAGVFLGGSEVHSWFW